MHEVQRLLERSGLHFAWILDLIRARSTHIVQAVVRRGSEAEYRDQKYQARVPPVTQRTNQANWTKKK